MGRTQSRTVVDRDVNAYRFSRIMKISKFFIFLLLIIVTRIPYLLYVKHYSPNSRQFWFSGEMERAAINLATEGRLANVLMDDSGVSAHVAPLYPGFLSVLHRLGGLDLVRLRWAEGLSAILSTALCVALMPTFAARARLSKGVGEWAALLMVLSPLGFRIEILGDWEATFVPLALAAALWSLMALHDVSWGDLRLATAAGMVIGVGALLSPVVLPGVLLALLGEALACRSRARVVQFLLGGSILLGASALTIAPWIYRNYVCFSAFVPIRSSFGLELAIGNNDETRDVNTDSAMAMRFRPITREDEKLKALGEVAFNRIKMHEAWVWIKAHPGRFAWLTARRLVLFWFPSGNGAWGGGTPTFIPAPIKSATIGIVTVLAFVGLAWLFAGRHPYRFLIAGIFIGPSLPYLVTHVSFRYRYPLLWLTFLLACECIARGRSRVSVR